MVGRDFLTLKHFSPKEIQTLLWTAKDLKARYKRERGKVSVQEVRYHYRPRTYYETGGYIFTLYVSPRLGGVPWQGPARGGTPVGGYPPAGMRYPPWSGPGWAGGGYTPARSRRGGGYPRVPPTGRGYASCVHAGGLSSLVCDQLNFRDYIHWQIWGGVARDAPLPRPKISLLSCSFRGKLTK